MQSLARNGLLCVLGLSIAWGCSSSETQPGGGSAAGNSHSGGSAGQLPSGAAGAIAAQATAGSGDQGQGGNGTTSSGGTAGSAPSAGNTSAGTAAGAASSGAGGAGGAGGPPESGGAAGNAGAGATGTAETIHYYGRWNRMADRVVTVNSGSYVSAQFSGTGISARFDVSLNDTSDLPTIAWRVDQAATWQVAEVSSTMMMGSGLSSGVHTITVIARGLDENKNRWSAPLVSSVTFLGFDISGGMLEPAVAPVQPKLEILGDSITEGVIVQGGSYQGKSGQCWKNDAVYSYPTQTGMALGADYRQVGFGYQGLLKTGDGGVPAANDAFPWIYKDAPRDAWQADMVVINQGTNDSAKPTATFKTAYTTFVGTIRSAYPKAKIVALRPFSGAQEAQIKAVVDASHAAGDTRVYYVDTTGWLTPGSDFADGLHPNVQGSAKAATKLVAEIKKIGFP